MINLKELKPPYYHWKLNWTFVDKPVQIFKTRIESCYRDERTGYIYQVWKQNGQWFWRQYARNGTVSLNTFPDRGFSTRDRAMYAAQVLKANVKSVNDNDIPANDLPDWLLEELEQYDIKSP